MSYDYKTLDWLRSMVPQEHDQVTACPDGSFDVLFCAPTTTSPIEIFAFHLVNDDSVWALRLIRALPLPGERFVEAHRRAHTFIQDFRRKYPLELR